MNKRIRKKKLDQARRAWAAALDPATRRMFKIDRNGRCPPITADADPYWLYVPAEPHA